MTFETRRAIAAGHPALAGHFPGNPIVPGTLILDEVLRAVEAWQGQVRVTRVVSAKFMAVLKPDQCFTIKLNERGDSGIEFECTLDGRTLASGQLAIEPGPDVS